MNRLFLFCVFQRAIRESPLQNTNILMRTSLKCSFFLWWAITRICRTSTLFWKNCGIKTLCQHSVILIFKDLFAGGRFKSTDSKHIAVLISVIAEFQNNYAVCKTGSSSVSAAVPFRRHFLTVSPFSLPERGMSRLFFPRSARCLWACCLLPCCPVFATFPTPFCRLYILFPHRPLILR